MRLRAHAHAPDRPNNQQAQKQKRDTQHTTQNKKTQREKYHTLQDNEKVIAPNPKGNKAKHIADQRDKEEFGAENVVQEQDCTGTITEPVELSKKKWRKLCVDQ